VVHARKGGNSTMSKKALWIKNASQVVTAKENKGPLAGKEMRNLTVIENGSVWIEGDQIVTVGTTKELEQKYERERNDATIIDASHKIVTPGLIDPHTHAVYAGSREEEFYRRFERPTSYLDLLEEGGGIHSTVVQTQEEYAYRIYQQSYERLTSFLAHGVTTIEVKSGYGLELETELKQLQIAKMLNDTHAVDVVSTFLGAHVVPLIYKKDTQKYVNLLIHEMIPQISSYKLAAFNDAVCLPNAFSFKQCQEILEAGKSHGMLPKIHADPFEYCRGAELAAEVGAISADYLLYASDEGLKKLAEKRIVATLLPGNSLFVGMKWPDARKMIDLGVPVTLSTDCNPGSSPTTSQQFVMNLACMNMNMSPEEVLVATTINAAHAINQGDKIGSIEAGKQADLAIFNVSSYRTLQYHYGLNHIDSVVKKGEVVVENGKVL